MRRTGQGGPGAARRVAILGLVVDWISWPGG
jgi:hypothetical protein